MRYDCKAYCNRLHPLQAPKPGGSVWPRQNCPAFAPRKEHLPTDGIQCWFCRYADFRLKCPVALEVGICCWPEKQME
ncbi:MAG: hypothetical protein ACOX7N_04880 [Lawsonibacter sp.]